MVIRVKRVELEITVVLISTAKRCVKIKTAKSDVAKYLRTKDGSTNNAAIKDMNCGNFLIDTIQYNTIFFI